LTPADFNPATNPPRHVAVKLALVADHGRGRGGEAVNAAHSWSSALFGDPGSTIAVSIRVAK
jgi:hypothetical protein